MDTCGSVCESVPSETELDVSHVQGKSRICKVIHEKIKAARISQCFPHIQVVGLYGGGGTGKTTFCKAMCNEMRTEFNGKVYHIELKGENELRTIQTMLTKLIGGKNEDVQRLNNYECGRKLGKSLRHKVFIAIDNVTDSAKVIAQAEALLNLGYAKGSVALVTARSYDQLEEMKINGYTIYESDCIEMPELEENEARSLLLYHASPSNHVNEDVLIQCLQRCYFRKDDDDCHFLPLALEVFGLQLGDDADQWQGKLEERDTLNQPQESEHPIFSLLRKSFDALNNEDQILFMDAALFCPRKIYYDPSDMSKGWNISTLDWLHMVHGGSVEDIKTRLKGLKEKSLLQSIDERSTEIGVHDLWCEFAVIEANVGKKDSSLWFYDNDEDDQTDRYSGESSFRGGGWENLQRAFIWKRSKFKEELNFSLCSNLTVLTLRNVPLVNKNLDLSPLKCLKYLEVNLYGRPGSVRVLGLGSLGRLVVLRWFRMLATSPCLQEIGLLTNLQVLQLQFLPRKKTDYSRLNFQQMDFSGLSLLRIFSLIATGDNWMGFQSFADVRSLMHEVEQWRDYGADNWRFHMNNVYLLESLQNFQKLQSLQELDISRCACINALPGLDELVALLELNASGCKNLKELPNLLKLQSLQRLDVSFCFLIAALPGLDELVVLLELDTRGCYNLEEFPNLQKLQKLQRLDISVCSAIKAVPGLGELVALLELHAAGCKSLEELPNLQKLRRLQILDISWCPLIKALPGLGDLVALQELCAKDCFGLAELPDMRKLTSLRVLNLKISHYFEELRLKENEMYYSDYHSTSLKAVPGLDELITLSKLTVDFEVFEDVHDLRKLTNMTKLRLRGWSSGAAPGVASLPNLQFLKISYCAGLELAEPTGISSLTSLRLLHLYRCDFEAVSCLTSVPALQRLHVKYHENLKILLLSMLKLPSDLKFTVSVDTGDNRISMAVQEELDLLQARGIVCCYV